MAASALGGGDERMASRICGISDVISNSLSLLGVERRSDKVEYADWERNGFPRRGSDKRRVTVAERDYKTRLLGR